MPYYIRYMDDLVVFGNERDELGGIRNFITAYFTGLKLKMHPCKCKTYETKKGVKFLGYTIYPAHRLVVLSNVTRFKRRMARLALLFQQGRITLRRITCSIHSWLGYAKHANSYNIRRRIFAEIITTTPFGLSRTEYCQGPHFYGSAESATLSPGLILKRTLPGFG